MTSSIRSLWLPVLVAALLPGGVAGQAANETPVRGEGPEQRHPEAAQAIDALKSPYCPGLMLEVCPSPGGAALRDSLQALAEEGWTADQIVDWVVDNHGDEYRALPRRSGVSLVLAWLIPPIGVLVGLGLVVWALRRMRRARPPAAASSEGGLSESEEVRLRRALEELDAEEEATFF